MPRPVANPPNPWATQHVEWLEEPPRVALEVYEEDAKSILSENDSDDIPFRFSVNPYRGCFHGCAYCYARPTHQYAGFGAGTDFERRIVVKTNAPELLHRALSRPSWTGEPIVFSGVTDCYQPLEANYELTRRCLETCLAHRNAVGVITKGALVVRDAELLAEIASVATATVHLSIPFASPADARRLEPYAATPARRFEAMRRLAGAGVPVGISLAPVIPGLNDSDIPELLTRARDAGATNAFLTMLRLPAEVRPVFRERLAAAYPDRAAKIWSQIRDVRRGRENDSTIGRRMSGEGPRWRAIEDLFRLTCRRLGLSTGNWCEGLVARPRTVAPAGGRQGTLFGGVSG